MTMNGRAGGMAAVTAGGKAVSSSNWPRPFNATSISPGAIGGGSSRVTRGLSEMLNASV
jgi:hypothetical protein